MAEEIQRNVLPGSKAFDVTSLKGFSELDTQYLGVVADHVQLYINHRCAGVFPETVIDGERANAISSAKRIGLEEQAQALLDEVDKKYDELNAQR